MACPDIDTGSVFGMHHCMATNLKPAVERRRNRLNLIPLVIFGQWFGLVAAWWMRYFPPLRPTGFNPSAMPSLLTIAVCLGICSLVYFLPKSYFRPRRFERGKFYRRLGVRIFRLMATDGDLVNRQLRRIDPSYGVVKSREQLREHIRGTYSNERWHLFFFLIGVCTQVFAMRAGEFGWTALLTLTNITFNLYPILHQRYKRSRLHRLNVD